MRRFVYFRAQRGVDDVAATPVSQNFFGKKTFFFRGKMTPITHPGLFFKNLLKLHDPGDKEWKQDGCRGHRSLRSPTPGSQQCRHILVTTNNILRHPRYCYYPRILSFLTNNSNINSNSNKDVITARSELIQELLASWCGELGIQSRPRD